MVTNGEKLKNILLLVVSGKLIAKKLYNDDRTIAFGS
jgi:hypothetical protein